MAEKVRLPRGSQRGIVRLLNERVRLERHALGELDEKAYEHANAVREVIGAFGLTPWTLQAHARVLRPLRELGRRYGAGVSQLARKHGREAARLGADQAPRALAIMAGAALGRRIGPPRIDEARALGVAVEHVELRTEDVGARAGEDLATAAISASYLEAQKANPATALAVGLAISTLIAKKARDRGSLVLTTEITAGAEWGGAAAREELAGPIPRIRKVWDATLDARVCSICAELHHTVVDGDDTFPGGYDDAPAHARCRCATLPWLDEWSDVLRDLRIGPGPRTGVQELAETHLAGWGDRAAGVDILDVTSVARPGVEGAPFVPIRPPPPPGGGGGSGGGGGGRRKDGDLGGGSPRRWYRADDRRPPGSISISKGRMPPKDEMETARLLAKHGNTVHFPDERLMPHGKKFDVYVNGSTRVEMKRLKPESSIETVSGRLNTSLKKEGQARTIIIDARQTAISEAEAKNMLERRIPGRWAGRLDRVRIIGADFDLERGYP